MIFTRRAIGLDIADHSIQIVEIEQPLFSHTPKVVSKARRSLERGIVEKGKVVLKKQLIEALSELARQAQPREIAPGDVIFGVPEPLVYTQILMLETDRATSLDEQIERIAHESIPLESADLVYAYGLISQIEGKREALLYGTSKEALADWDDVLAAAGFGVRAFDHELLAIARGMFGSTIPSPVCIVDSGAERTKIAVYSRRGLHYVHSIDRAGDYFTDEIAKSLDVPKEVAEQMKRDEGIVNLTLHALFIKLLDPIIAEIVTACDFFEKTHHHPVAEIVLVGGSAQLKGLTTYVQDGVGRPCRLGASLLPSLRTESDHDALHYIEALGLALKGLRKTAWEREHPSFKMPRAA